MAAPQGKVIITCAVTGSIHTPSMSPHLPISAKEIEDAAVGAIEAGCSIVHLHARDPQNGRPSQAVHLFQEFVGNIKQRCNGIINLTTGGSPAMTVEERLQPALQLKPEVASLNMGSMNFALFPMLAKYKEFKHEWEPQYLEASRDFIFRNTFKDIEYSLKHLGEGCGTRFEFECYDVGHLYNLAHLLERKLVKPPLFVQTIFGILGGIGPDPDNLMHMRSVANKLFGDDYEWSVLAAGRHQMALTTMAGICGGNVRVGLEDSIFLAKGRLAQSNAEQVAKIRRILEDLSLEIATPMEARQRLALKGMEKVAF